MKLKDVFEWPYYKEDLARHSSFWSDFYGVTMGQAAFVCGKFDTIVTSHSFIRDNCMGENGGYTVSAGSNIYNEWASNWGYDEVDLAILEATEVPDAKTGEMKRLFLPEYLDKLATMKYELTHHEMPEGEILFPHEPTDRITGPFGQQMLIELPKLNIRNSQQSFATLASRLKEVSNGAPVLAFGARRAQSIGALEPARGAYIGGADATSNTLAHKYYGIPIVGTFAHAWVMLYEDEMEAFKDYAKAMPNSGIFLVDTYNTIEGVKKAVKAANEMGITIKGIRLDSGDLAHLAKESRKLLDQLGCPDAKIVASNGLDEYSIKELISQGAPIDTWVSGTSLETAKPWPALGQVFKLGAVYNDDLSQADVDAMRQLVMQGRAPVDESFVRDVIKLSENVKKVSIPGEMDVLRFVKLDDQGKAVRFDGDVIVPALSKDPVAYNTNPDADFPDTLAYDIESVPKDNEAKAKVFKAGTPVYRPLRQTFNNGALVGQLETVHHGRARFEQLKHLLDASHRRLVKPHEYVVGLERGLFDKRRAQILKRSVK